MGSSSQRILELDGLRALAVGGVIAFHYFGAALGWMGVDLFFVLSGYLITGILLAARHRPGYFRTFYARRTLRIFPVYYLLLLVYVIAARGWGGAQPWSYWGMHAGFLSATLEYFHFWAFQAPGFVYAGVTVLWSLSIEEQFYLIWAPVVRWMSARGLWIFLLVVVVGAPGLRYLLHTRTFPEYRFLPTRFDSLGWGAVLVMGRKHWTRRRLAAAGAGAGGVLVTLIAFTGGERSSLLFATFGYSALAVAFAACIGWTVLSAGGPAWVCRLLRARPLVYIGAISYTLYLVHYPILLAVGSLLHNLAARDVLAAGLSVAVAGLSWRYWERPILRLKERWAPARSVRNEPEERMFRTSPIVTS